MFFFCKNIKEKYKNEQLEKKELFFGQIQESKNSEKRGLMGQGP